MNKGFCSVKGNLSGDRYLDQKGIGFKSVFSVTDAPEIHSNEINFKFNKSDGLPTIVPPCDVNMFRKLVDADSDPMDEERWNTCILLPTKNDKFTQALLMLRFSSLYPHALLFLHRLKCIKYINLVKGVNLVMRKEVVGDGIVNIFHDYGKMTWFVKSSKLPVDQIRHDVQTTEISMALLLDDLDDGNYMAKLYEGHAFAFIRPLNAHGLNFIIQADFIVSSVGEVVDVDSPWNQWLLSEFPNLFVSAERSFCSLPCFKENQAKAVSNFMSLVPLGGEVHRALSSLPHMIISKLCVSNCLLLEGDVNEWVPPCKVVRNWTEQIRSLLPDSLIRDHLDVGYLNKDVVLSDSLAQALGIDECGPKFLVQVMLSLYLGDSLKSLGLGWLSSWLNVLFLMLVDESEYDVISFLSQLPFIPLFDGNYASVSEGEIWLLRDEPGFEMFGRLYPSPKFRIVDPDLFSNHPENVTEMLYKFGVQRLSAHEVFKVQILPSICDEKVLTESTELMIEYLSFVMYHLESRCSKCRAEKEHIFSQLRNNAYISTNYGCKRPVDVPIHFSKEFGNVVDMNKLVDGTNIKWYEIDIGYLKHPVYKSTPKGTLKWRKFLQKLGVTDFVQVVEVEKRAEDIKYTSPELMDLLSHVTMHDDREKSKYLLKVLDTLWDGHFSNKPYKSYVIRMLHGDPWVASSIDDRLHLPKDLFHNCQVVRTVLGHRAPYTVPKVSSAKFLNDIGLKKTVTLDDALSILEVWRGSNIPLRASISQMSKFYTYLWNKMSSSKLKIVKKLHSQAFIFVPHSFSTTHELASGSFLSPSDVYWHDSFGSVEQTKSIHPLINNKLLCNVYPGLHNFFVNEFGVAENPTLLSYLQSLQQLSNESLPSQAAKTFFHVLKKWSDGLDSWDLSSEDVDYMKKTMEKRNTRIFPTLQNKWVSLHQSFGLLSTEEKQMLRDKVSVLFRRLGIPSLYEVVTREAIYSGMMDNSFIAYFINGALPYAQRYIYSFHRKQYSEFKNLKIVVVEKLFYKNVIKKFGIESNKRVECSCLLQDNILYATPASDSDSHALFMELSRFLVAGVPELPLANFLHRILTTESGYIEEQMELFLTNKQKLLKLPSEESEWSMFSISSPEEGNLTPTTSSGFSPDVLSPTKSTSKKLGRRSRRKPASKTKEDHDEASVIRKEDEALKDQSGSGIYKDMNDRFISNERTLVALNSEGKDNEESAEKIIECIRREELECVRNADENMYPCDVEPTLTFILQETGVIVLSNDQGFSVETIKALCKVGNSSKTEPSTGYISKKGIGFRSVFRGAWFTIVVGLHVKFGLASGRACLRVCVSTRRGAIWLHTDPEHGLEAFGKLYSKLRIVNPALFSDHVENITQMLYKVGVQRLSAHEVLKKHVLPAICDEKVMAESTELMIEYLSFVMFHLEPSCCSECLEEKEHILSQLRNNAFVSTNHGYKRLADVPIHFSKQFGNLIDMSKLVSGSDMQWFEIDIGYLKHGVCKSSPEGTSKWRNFLQELGVTDFVKIVEVEKLISDIPNTVLKNMMLDDDCVSSGSIVIDYDSQELTQLLSHVSSNGNKVKGKYLLKVLDELWDDYFSDTIIGLCEIDGEFRPFKSSVLKILHSVQWMASSMDDQLHFSKDLFHNCEIVRSILGHRAPYSVPKVNSVKFLNDIGLKQIITPDDALSIIDAWRRSKKPFRASISQMSKFYTYLWSEMSISKRKIVETLRSQAFIFVPSSVGSTSEVVSGLLLSPSEVYWHDSTISSIEQTKSTKPQLYEYMTHRVYSKMLCSVYPHLRHFFVQEFGVAENPPLLCYLQFLLQLSKESLPAHAAKAAFQVFQKWSDGINSGVLSCVDVDYMKKIMEEKETTILPTVQDKWVSLHESFGHIYWCDDEQLKKEFMDLSNVHFLCLGELTNEEKQMIQDEVSVLFRRLGIPCLSEVVTREVIHCGPTDSSYMISLVRWALPYVQRYIYRMHTNEYSQLKLTGFRKVNSLKIVVVEKLCQKYVIKNFGIESKERECCCFLQDNVLLRLANFLFLITTKAQSGFKEEDMELFVTNNQKLPNLPCEELQWSLASTSSPEVESTTTNKKLGKNSSWPPVHWKTTPGVDKTNLDAAEGLIESNGDWIIDENPSSSMPIVIVEDDEALNDQSDSVINKGKNKVSVPPQNVITGREGEHAAFEYFSSTLSDKKVKWVNEVKESGLPYDILVKGKDKSKEYIEVKSTSVAKKDWFTISMNEWKFAVEKGESFIVARVVLSDGNVPKITTYKNPAKLLQSRHLQLAFHPSKK
ncbi:histidine kinase-, DNA gyrase B-, and HSP90-like ATPase family protein [Tanacetum coccineum]